MSGMYTLKSVGQRTEPGGSDWQVSLTCKRICSVCDRVSLPH